MSFNSILKFINIAETAYNKELKLFKNQLHFNKSKVKNLPNENFYLTAFKTNSSLIILEGDKNIGYVRMYLSDLLKQYEKINIQQHFGKTTRDKKKNILTFILNTNENLTNN